MRTPIMAGNWKMNCDNTEAATLAQGIADGDPKTDKCDAIVCPPYTALTTVRDALATTEVALGAENMFWEDSGAYTGEISPPMLLSCGCEHVIIGHSERRGRFGSPDEDFTQELQDIFGDNDATVNKKIIAACEAGLKPIVCVGELLDERQAGDTDSVVESQVLAALECVSGEQATMITLAYEPVWAIGTGEVCEADEANRVCGMIRGVVADATDQSVADAMRILYGGSVKPGNVRGLMEMEDIDGGLVGGASLEAASFLELIEVAGEVKAC